MNTSYCSQIGHTTKGFLLTFMTGPGNSFYIVCKGEKLLWDLIFQELPVKGKVFFWVLSFTNNMSGCYEVCFGNEHEMPKCSCYDSDKTGYLCKHCFAGFEKFPLWSFNVDISRK